MNNVAGIFLSDFLKKISDQLLFYSGSPGLFTKSKFNVFEILCKNTCLIQLVIWRGIYWLQV